MKYAFILSFHAQFDNDLGYAILETTVLSKSRKLNYSVITKAKEYMRNECEKKSGAKVTGLVLLNCTRTLNDSVDEGRH